MNFNDPEFVRHIYKALRLELITVNQMMDALMLHGMKTQFKGMEIKAYSFEEKGPFSPAAINFLNPAITRKFQEEIAKLPKNEQQYFSVNVPRLQLLPFLLFGLQWSNGQHFNQRFYIHYSKFINHF